MSKRLLVRIAVGGIQIECDSKGILKLRADRLRDRNQAPAHIDVVGLFNSFTRHRRLLGMHRRIHRFLSVRKRSAAADNWG